MRAGRARLDDTPGPPPASVDRGRTNSSRGADVYCIRFNQLNMGVEQFPRRRTVLPMASPTLRVVPACHCGRTFFLPLLRRNRRAPDWPQRNRRAGSQQVAARPPIRPSNTM